MSRVFRIPGYTADDLRQECELAKLTAEPPGLVAARRNLIDLLRAATRGRQAALNGAVPFDHELAGGAVEDDTRLEARALLHRIRTLPAVQARVLLMEVCGFSYGEIAATLGLRRKQVDNRLQEARRMLKDAA